VATPFQFGVDEFEQFELELLTLVELVELLVQQQLRRRVLRRRGRERTMVDGTGVPCNGS